MEWKSHILLVEDNDACAELVREYLEGQSSHYFVVDRCVTLAAGMERASHGSLDAALLDLGLPDSLGLETFSTFHERFPDVPVIIFSGNEDQALVRTALEEGAQECLVKGRINNEMLIHSLCHAIERQRSTLCRETLRKEEALRRESLWLERMLQWSAEVFPPVESGSRPGVWPPALLERWAEAYLEALDAGWVIAQTAQRNRRVDILVSLASDLGSRGGGPCDLLELHVTVMERWLASGMGSADVLERSRMLVLELMGHLVSFYRGTGCNC